MCAAIIDCSTVGLMSEMAAQNPYIAPISAEHRILLRCGRTNSAEDDIDCFVSKVDTLQYDERQTSRVVVRTGLARYTGPPRNLHIFTGRVEQSGSRGIDQCATTAEVELIFRKFQPWRAGRSGRLAGAEALLGF